MLEIGTQRVSAALDVVEQRSHVGLQSLNLARRQVSVRSSMHRDAAEAPALGRARPAACTTATVWARSDSASTHDMHDDTERNAREPGGILEPSVLGIEPLNTTKCQVRVKTFTRIVRGRCCLLFLQYIAELQFQLLHLLLQIVHLLGSGGSDISKVLGDKQSFIPALPADACWSGHASVLACSAVSFPWTWLCL